MYAFTFVFALYCAYALTTVLALDCEYTFAIRLQGGEDSYDALSL